MASEVLVIPRYGVVAGAVILVFALTCLVIAGSALIGSSMSLRDNTVVVRAPFRRRREFPVISIDRLVSVQVQGTGYIALIGKDGTILATLGNSFAPDDLERFGSRSGIPVTFTEQSMIGHMLSGPQSSGARARYGVEQTFSGSLLQSRRGRNSAAFVLAVLAAAVFVVAAIFGHR